jgi:GH15 family glucan-1,4-alpha-glucosidase
MPRPLVFGNGRLLVQIDHRGNILDLAWPIGIWNHLSSRAIRIGVWADGLFQWMDGFGWTREQRYLPLALRERGLGGEGNLVGEEMHENSELGVRLRVLEWIDQPLTPPPSPLPIGTTIRQGGGVDRFVRHITVENLRGTSRDVRVFIGHDLRLLESDIAECALWHPGLEGIIHHKGPCAVLLRASGSNQYNCGAFDHATHAGPWLDAEDGVLKGIPISQGTTDSCLGVACPLEPHGTHEFTYEIAFAESICALEQLSSPPPSPLPATRTIRGEGEPEFHLAVIKTQISETGAILAANDSDIMGDNRANYSCCWPRDGALVAHELVHAGALDFAERYLRYSLEILRERPYFLQKYRADGTLGPSWHPWTVDLPIQLDETASFVSLAVACLQAGIPMSDEDIEIGIKQPAKFLLDYREDDLPKPSYDLWEERRGVFAYTVATVIRALRDVADVQPSRTLSEAEEKMTAAFEERFWNAGEIYFQRAPNDPTFDASTLHVGLLGVLPIDDVRVQASAVAIAKACAVERGIGGLARYPGDYYHRINERHPGNPWIITTMWLAQHEAMSGRPEKARELLEWALSYAHPTGLLPEQMHPDTGEALSVSPLTWSHAEVLKTLRLLG